MDIENLFALLILTATVTLYLALLMTMPLPKTIPEYLLFILTTAVPPLLWFRAAYRPKPPDPSRPGDGFLAVVAALGFAALILIFTQTAVSAIAVNPVPFNAKLPAALAVWYGPAVIPWLRLGHTVVIARR